MLLTMHGYCYDLYLLTFPGVRDVFPIITFRRLLINADLLPQYGQTVFVLTCSSLNHDSSTQTIRNGLSDGPLSRRRGQSLHAELNLVGSITLPDISYRRFYRRLPFGIFRQALFFSFSDIKPHGLDESFQSLHWFLLASSFPSQYYQPVFAGRVSKNYPPTIQPNIAIFETIFGKFFEKN